MNDEPVCIATATIDPDDDGPERQFWNPVKLLLMSDGTIQWEEQQP